MQTITERLSNPTQAGLDGMSSVKNQLLGNFKSSKEYRHAFVEEKVRTQLAVQIKAIREQRNISRPEFATLMQKAPSWVFRLEDPNQSPPTISTLLQVAEAFDVDLEIRFRRFSGLLNQLERLTPESFEVPSFDDEVRDSAFDRSVLHEDIAMFAGASATGGSVLFLAPPPVVSEGVRMRTRRSPRISRRAAFAIARKAA
jgi:transcriptional regulator with XRE-family HTH domain